MKDLDLSQKYAILHCAFQIIASAEGSIDENRDYQAIDILLDTLGFSSVHAWDKAVQLNPYDSFQIVSMLDNDNKSAFKNLMMEIVEIGGNTALRKTCALSVFTLCDFE